MSTQELLRNTDAEFAATVQEHEAVAPAPSPGMICRLAHAMGHAHTRRAILTLIDQGAVSGTNFVTTVILGRFCLQEELGLYALGFSLVMLLGGSANALIWMPYTFNSPRERADRFARFTGSVTIQMALFCLLTAIGLGATAAITAIRGGHPELSGLFAVLAAAGTMMLFREFMRRVYLAQMRVGRALLLDLTMALLQLAGLAFVVRHGTLSAQNTYGIIALVGAILAVGWLATEGRRLKVRRQAVWADWRQNWKTGRWMFAANMVRLAAMDIYPWILAAFHGVQAVAVLAAARGVVFFANPLMLAIGNFAGPFAAHASVDHGPRGLWRRVMWGTLGMVAVMGAFCTIVSIWGGDLMQLLYGPQYAGQAKVIRALAIGQLAEAAGIPVAFGLLAVQRADYELVTAVLQLVVMVSLGFWLVWYLGPAGVGYGYAAAFLAAGAFQWVAFRRIVQHA